MSPPSVYATTLNWNDQGNSRWIGFSKTIAQAVDLPLLGWQISIGHTGLSNAVNEYEDTFFPFFFAHQQEYINAGFIGMLAGCANQDKGTVATIDANAVGDKGWFYGQLATFNAKRPYNLNVAPSRTMRTVPAVAAGPTALFRIVNRSIIVDKSLPGPAVLELFSSAGRTVRLFALQPGESVSLSSLPAGMYLSRMNIDKSVQTGRLVIR
jgi:hypothetical protein